MLLLYCCLKADDHDMLIIIGPSASVLHFSGSEKLTSKPKICVALHLPHRDRMFLSLSDKKSQHPKGWEFNFHNLSFMLLIHNCFHPLQRGLDLSGCWTCCLAYADRCWVGPCGSWQENITTEGTPFFCFMFLCSNLEIFLV